MNIDNLGVAVPIISTKETFPSQPLQIAFSYLKHRDLQSTAVVCRFWNASVFDMVKNREFNALRNFAMLISENLDEKLYPEKKKKLSQFHLSNLEFRCHSIKAVNEIMDAIKAVIQSILSTIEDKDLSKIFDLFIGKKKPPSFFEFVFTSAKYSSLDEDLNRVLGNRYFSPGGIFSIDGMREIRQLIAKGAIPSTLTLSTPLICAFSLEVVKTLLDAGAIPTTKNSLALAMIHNNSLEVLTALLEAGAIPTAETLELALEHGRPEVVRALLDAGAMPTTETLTWASNYRCSPEILTLLEEARVQRKIRKLALE